MGLQFFDEIRLPDVPGKPKMRDAAGPWFRDIVRASFGSWDPEGRVRYIRDIMTMAPKGSSKTSYSAGLMLSVMLMNQRPRAEALFVGPTQAISDRAYEQTVGMIDESKEFKRRFRPRDHIKTIEDLFNRSEMKVKTFDLSILTGSILIFVLLDELHLLGRSAHTTKVLRQIRGGLDKTPEGQLLITTTQSDDIPIGAFREELMMARKIRDGKYRGRIIRSMLPVLYEFPSDIAQDRARWEDPVNWPMVMPNLGRSVHLGTLVPDWESEKDKGEHAIRVWASQHLNIEIGLALSSERWIGADHWEANEDPTLTLDEILARSEVVVVGIDGGGLKDLLGLAIIGRDSKTKALLHWGHAWVQKSVIKERKEIASTLLEFENDGDLSIVDKPGPDTAELADIVLRVWESGLMPEKNGIGVDQVGIRDIVDAVVDRGIPAECIAGIGQGWKLNNSILDAERALGKGGLKHSGQRLMAWCLGNAKAELKGSAITITKQGSGTAKIDPLMALFDAIAVIRDQRHGVRSGFDQDPGDEEPQTNADEASSRADDLQIIGDPTHPQWNAARERLNAAIAAEQEEDVY